MNIDKDIKKALTPFEVKELTKILEAVETKEYYASGYKNLNGGYAEIKVDDIEYGDYYDEDTDEEIDAITFWLESGVQDMGSGHTSSDSFHLKISRGIVGDKKLDLQAKIKAIDEY